MRELQQEQVPRDMKTTRPNRGARRNRPEQTPPDMASRSRACAATAPKPPAKLGAGAHRPASAGRSARCARHASPRSGLGGPIGLGLVVGGVECRGAGSAQHRPDLGAHFEPQQGQQHDRGGEGPALGWRSVTRTAWRANLFAGSWNQAGSAAERIASRSPCFSALSSGLPGGGVVSPPPRSRRNPDGRTDVSKRFRKARPGHRR